MPINFGISMNGAASFAQGSPCSLLGEAITEEISAYIRETLLCRGIARMIGDLEYHESLNGSLCSAGDLFLGSIVREGYEIGTFDPNTRQGHIPFEAIANAKLIMTDIPMNALATIAGPLECRGWEVSLDPRAGAMCATLGYKALELLKK